MPVIGNIIKGFIEIRDYITPEKDHIKLQEKVLEELLEKARDTAFGKHYHFETVLASDNRSKTFSKIVPGFDYDTLNRKWWHRLHDGEYDVTWPGNPDYFALSSGTTGKTSKRIPVTKDMIEVIRNAGIKQIYALANFNMPPEFFEKDILMLGSSTDLTQTEGHQEGEISGISASNIPGWFQGFYKPGIDIASIEDWDQRVLAIAKKAKEWDVGAISGIPSWIELMLKKIIEYHNVETIHDIWPNFQVYTSGGIAFGPYEKSFRALTSKPLQIIDTYLASEGFLAFQARPETDAMQLITDNGVYFEFVPFDAQYINEDGSLKEGFPSYTLAEVEPERDYILLISTVAGAWRYLIGDTIKFTDVSRAEIKITGRTKFFLNTVGSQLSVNKLNDAVKHLEDKLSIQIPEFTISAIEYDNEYYHHWFLGTSNPDNLNSEKAAAILDNYLKKVNKNYKVARSRALKGVKVNAVTLAAFYEWNAQKKKKGGQVKMEKVMKPEKFKQWKKFVSNLKEPS
ncbi:GH3 family domain-containing protein [Ascidiimonas aurantiaca]|uniref:GH3 family domain-containing protein n=1 Tax=Ascidiimonas aurantiaca TaxID=1685432 RepID=UPI0030ED710E